MALPLERLSCNRQLRPATQRLGGVSTLLGVGNVAEIEFYRNGIRVTGADYGTRGSWNNNGKTSQKALDGDVHTRFDGPSPNGIYVGIASSSPATNLSARK